jgi:hypothetical protein
MCRWLRHWKRARAIVLLSIFGVAAPLDAQTSPAFPAMEELRVLPRQSVKSIDHMLDQLARAYAAKDLEAFLAHFTDDFEQTDVNRRVHVSGKSAWREQTVRVNAAHREMGRIHHGRALVGDWLVVELEWFGTVRSEALADAESDRSYRYGGLGLLQLDGNRIRRQILFGDIVTLERDLGMRTRN